MDNHVERLTLPDGGWWELRTIITRGMRKQINQASIRALGPNAGKMLAGPDGAAQLLEHPEAIDVNAVDDAMLLIGTVAYSYADQVSLEVMDQLPDEITNLVLARLHELYADLAKAEQAAFFGRR